MAEKINLSEEQVQQIKHLFVAQNMGTREIVKELGLSRSIVRRVIIENGFKHENVDKYSFIEKDTLQGLYVKQGLSIAKVAKFLKVPQGVISNKLKEFNIPVRKRNSKELPVGDVLPLYNKGLSLVQIAEELKISVSYVSAILKKEGIKVRRGKSFITREELKNYKDKGFSYRKIATKLDCSVNCILDKCLEYGLAEPKTDIDIGKLEELCKLGKTIDEMTEELRCGRKTVTKLIKYHGLIIHTYQDKLEGVTYAELYEKLINQGKTLEDVASDYKVGISILKRKLKELDLSVTTERSKHITEDTIKHLYFDLNLTQEEIAKELKCSRNVIADKFKEFHIHKPTMSEQIDIEQLKDLYINQNLPACDISKIIGIKSSVIRKKIFDLQLDKLKTPEQKRECFIKSRDTALSHSRSKAELELQKLFPTEHINVHNIINLELDLFYPEQRVAIEYNGDYWHSLLFKRNSGLHLAKLSMCKNHHIQLINIFERDWHNPKIKPNIITLITRTLYPDKLLKPEGIIKKVFKIKQEKFENKFNINRYKISDYCVGTYYNKEVINSVSYNIIDNKCVVTNFTTKADYREDYTDLFKYIKAKHNLPIILKLDKRYYSNPSVATNLFSYVKEIKPELYYVYNTKALRKSEASESYLSQSRCYPVYDCGFLIYQY